MRDPDPTSTPVTPTATPFPTFTPVPPTATPTLISEVLPEVLPKAGLSSGPGDRTLLAGLLAVFAGGTIFFLSTRRLQDET